MAAILSDGESRDFHRFLQAFDSSDSSEAAIVGGAELVVRRPAGAAGGGGGWEGTGYSTATHTTYQPTDTSPYPPHPAAGHPFPHLHAPAPSPYHPAAPQHTAQPSSYPISYAAPPLGAGFAPPPPPPNPYPSAPLDTLDSDKLERMARQARELSGWMSATEGAAPLPPSSRRSAEVRSASGERPELGDEGRRGGSSTLLAPEGARRGGRRGYSHERPPLMHPTASGISAEDTMQRMREAEERAGFARRVKEANYEEDAPQATRPHIPMMGVPPSPADYNRYNQPLRQPEAGPSSLTFAAPRPPRAHTFSATPPPPAPSPPSYSEPVYEEPLPTPQPPPPPPPTNRKAPSKTKGKAAAPRVTNTAIAPPPNDTEFDTDPALNPAPFLTPANIPPSPFPAPPRVVRPRPPSSTASTSNATSTPSTGTNGGKPALLSAEQKKANHIASEQKRRAAIRQGYEALCTVVPSLKAAVEEFEERVKKLGAAGGGGGGRGGKKRRGSGGAVAGPLSGGIEVGGEKVDGRAGPKSEAVVLSKTVEHLRNILHERQAQLERLSALYQLAEDSDAAVEGGRRVWEEHWDGGPVVLGNGVDGGMGEDADEDM